MKTTERYEYRTSNLMHSYYAVNSVDGRAKIIFETYNLKLWNRFKNILVLCKKSLFDPLNFQFSGFATGYRIIISPRVVEVPTHLIINKPYISKYLSNGLEIKKYNNYLCNTTHK